MRIALALVALCLPGMAWWLWLGDHDQDGGEALARIFAVSVSFISLATLAFYTVRLKITPLVVGLLLSLMIGLVLTGLIHSWKTAFNKTWVIALVGLAVFIIWRIWQAKELVFPNWVDSQHHVLIIRKIIENGGLPSTLEPYLPGPFYYHFAFHAVTAFFSVLSGLAPEQAVLLLGQVINACVGISIYALAKAMSKNWRVGVLAALFVTFATKMPGYYLTWGRYTLLIGVMLLPVAMAEVIHVKEQHEHWWQMAGLTLLTAGTLLSHYFTAFLLALFLIVLAIIWFIRSLKDNQFQWKEMAALMFPALGGLVLVSRWYWRVFRYSQTVFNPGVTRSASTALDVNQWRYFWTLVGPNSGHVVLTLAVIGVFIGFFRPKGRGLALWGLLVGLLALPLGLRVAPFRSDHFALVLFLPACCLAAVSLDWASKWRKNLWQPVGISACITALVAFMLVFGAQANSNVINSDTVLVEQADAAALQWIDTHTPPDARFFINTTPWGYELYRGVDGGGWILPSTGRWSLAPTIFYSFGGDKAFTSQLSTWAERAASLQTCSEEFWVLAQDADLQYIYIHEGKGSLQATALQSCVGLKQLYSASGVSIWLIESWME
jgi:hypothetical protein